MPRLPTLHSLLPKNHSLYITHPYLRNEIYAREMKMVQGDKWKKGEKMTFLLVLSISLFRNFVSEDNGFKKKEKKISLRKPSLFFTLEDFLSSLSLSQRGSEVAGETQDKRIKSENRGK